MENYKEQAKDESIVNLSGEEAKQKIKEMTKDGNMCFFCTHIQNDKPFSARPMSVQKVDDEGNYWFLSDKDSGKNHEIETDDAVQLLFQNSSSSDYLSIYGKATITRDKAKIEELWEPIAKVWFTEGKEDPSISVIKITPTEGYYWDTKHGKVVAFAKMIVGAVTGKTLDDSIEGKLKV
jgi:general stress protein 26